MEEWIRRSPGRPKIADKSREQKILFDCGVRLPSPNRHTASGRRKAAARRSGGDGYENK